jgi:hypothetical protein
MLRFLPQATWLDRIVYQATRKSAALAAQKILRSRFLDSRLKVIGPDPFSEDGTKLYLLLVPSKGHKDEALRILTTD